MDRYRSRAMTNLRVQQRTARLRSARTAKSTSAQRSSTERLNALGQLPQTIDHQYLTKSCVQTRPGG